MTIAGGFMRKCFLALGMFSSFTFVVSTGSAQTLARFDAGFGVHPVGGINATTGAPVLNTVRTVPPGGRPWAIDRLRARVRTDGSITVRGEGLVLAGSDSVGTRGTVTHVAASFSCDPGSAGSTSPAAPLSVGGNFDIRGRLTPPPPVPCASPALLIRNATGNVLGAWFAGGTLSDRDDD
jgi:hypothetical protein